MCYYDRKFGDKASKHLHIRQDKKRASRPSLMSATTGSKDNLLAVRDNISGLTFLIDTGARRVKILDHYGLTIFWIVH